MSGQQRPDGRTSYTYHYRIKREHVGALAEGKSFRTELLCMYLVWR